MTDEKNRAAITATPGVNLLFRMVSPIPILTFDSQTL